MRSAICMLLFGALLTGASGCAVRSNVGAYMDTPEAPASAAERDRRCDRYAQRLDRNRRHMERRNVIGRIDLLRASHRRMERFVDSHCD